MGDYSVHRSFAHLGPRLSKMQHKLTVFLSISKSIFFSKHLNGTYPLFYWSETDHFSKLFTTLLTVRNCWRIHGPNNQHFLVILSYKN